MQVYLVGGAVRDQLLGLKGADRDYVVVGSTVEEMKKLGFNQVGRDFPVFLHPKTHEEYALPELKEKTVMAMLALPAILIKTLHLKPILFVEI